MGDSHPTAGGAAAAGGRPLLGTGKHDHNAHTANSQIESTTGYTTPLPAAASFIQPNDPHPFVAIVTGSNRGIGFEYARQLALRYIMPHAPNGIVYAAMRNVHDQSVIDSFKDLPCVRLLALDITSQPSVKAAVEQIKRDRVEKVHLLVNNAAFGSRGGYESHFLTCDLDDLQETLNVNCVGQVRVIQAFHSLMAPQQHQQQEQSSSSHSCCVCLSSRMASNKQAQQMGGTSVYRTAKAAMNIVVSTLSHDDPAVTYLSLSPGHVATTMGKRGKTKPPLEPDQSVDGQLRVIWGIRHEESGAFKSFDGSTIEF